MSCTVMFNTAIAIAQGPSIALDRTLSADAYELVNITVAAGVTDLTVNAAPGSASTIELLCITSTVYDSAVTCKDATAGAVAVTLDQPLVLCGKSAVGLFSTATTLQLLFSNATTGDAVVTILVARSAIV